MSDAPEDPASEAAPVGRVLADLILPGSARPHPELDALIGVLAVLRAPGGCAWDREQTHRSLVTHLVEESYELVDAIESGSRHDLVEELGDVLYQVLFHADLAAEDADDPFTIEDVAAAARAKMVGRHPHVFGTTAASGASPTAGEVVARWEDLKAQEKPGRTSVLDGIPRHLPSLQLADKLLGRAARVGVVVPAAREDAAPVPETETELGVALMTMVVEARARGLDAERALRSATTAVEQRIRAAEDAAPATPSAP
jgi:XTP/dITP diphosphohydrolase